VLIEAKGLFRKTTYHRQKAHLILSALRHVASERGDNATYVQAETFAEGLASIKGPLEVVSPHSRSATAVIQRLEAQGRDVSVFPARGYMTSESEFQSWVDGRGKRRLLLEDWYRTVRVSHEILIEDGEPAGGRWNFDEDNRQPPPRGAQSLGLPTPWTPVEDDIDAQVRRDLDAWEKEGIEFFGSDGPRIFPVTRSEARLALDDFVKHRLPEFGPFEDALMSEDWLMAHSGLSVPMNLGLVHPSEVVHAAEEAWASGLVPIASAEGFIRQIVGWREYVWHLYWHFGKHYVDNNNALQAHEPLPVWFKDAKSEVVGARCLSWALAEVHNKGWTHHIVRLMILGNWALQRAYDPAEMTRWFQRTFLDGYPWVMAANTVGMALFADGGQMSTKPYAAGGAYINKMTNLCSGCRYKPTVRVGSDACPFTAGYWNFLEANQETLSGNHRMTMAFAGLRKLGDREALISQEAARGNDPP
jgi:deoxyribodipyrimidine photolyase-related protein